MSLRTGWTPEKDRNLISMRNDDGLNWLQISRALPGHDADECRTHYEYITGYESASIRGDPWTAVELADLWVLLHGKDWLAGTDWEYISSHFDDRTANECKARWAMQMQEQGPPSAMNRRHILQQTAIEGSVESNGFIMSTEDAANRQSQHLPETNDTRQQELDVFMSQSDIEVLLGETSNVTFIRDSALTVSHATDQEECMLIRDHHREELPALGIQTSLQHR